MAELQQAMLSVQKAQDRLMEADFRVGKARQIARKNGFSDVFRQQTRVRDCSIIKLGRMQFLFFVTFRAFNPFFYHAEYHFATLPESEDHFVVTLD